MPHSDSKVICYRPCSNASVLQINSTNYRFAFHKVPVAAPKSCTTTRNFSAVDQNVAIGNSIHFPFTDLFRQLYEKS